MPRVPIGRINMVTLPLIAHRDPGQPIAWGRAGAINAGRYLADVEALARLLPPGRHVLNLCHDRYRFMVTFGAALRNGQTTVLPPNHAPDVLAQVRAATGDHICVSDDATLNDSDIFRFPAKLPESDQQNWQVPHVAAEHLAAIVFTSGSTGTPRPNPKLWGRLVAGAHAEAVALSLSGAAPLHFLGTIPPQHMYGFESTVLLPMQSGGAVHAARPLFARDVADCLAQLPERRMLVTTPLHIRACLEEDIDFPALEGVVSAAAPLSQELARRCEQRYGTVLREIYGFTEAGMLATRRTAAEEAWQLMDGVQLEHDAAQWMVHGGHVNGRVPFTDLIEVVDARRFHLRGRAQDVLNIAGKRASLADLNHQLNSIPGVRDGVFHVPQEDGRRITRLMAFVVAPELSVAEIMAALRRTVDPAFMPRPLVKVPALPRTPSGKLPLDRLRELEAACE